MTRKRPDLRADPVGTGKVKRNLQGHGEPGRYPHEQTQAEPKTGVCAPVEERDDEQEELRLPEKREEKHGGGKPRRLILEHPDERDLNIGHTSPPRSMLPRSWGIAAEIPLMMNWMAMARTITARSFGTTRNPSSPM